MMVTGHGEILGHQKRTSTFANGGRQPGVTGKGIKQGGEEVKKSRSANDTGMSDHFRAIKK